MSAGHAKCDALYLRDGNAGIKWSNVIATKHVRSVVAGPRDSPEPSLSETALPLLPPKL